jgi:hypothetical protein
MLLASPMCGPGRTTTTLAKLATCVCASCGWHGQVLLLGPSFAFAFVDLLQALGLFLGVKYFCASFATWAFRTLYRTGWGSQQPVSLALTVYYAYSTHFLKACSLVEDIPCWSPANYQKVVTWPQKADITTAWVWATAKALQLVSTVSTPLGPGGEPACLALPGQREKVGVQSVTLPRHIATGIDLGGLVGWWTQSAAGNLFDAPCVCRSPFWCDAN